MSETSKSFKVAGIVSDDKGRVKVRYCNDLVGRVKLFSKNANTKRIDFVELPNPMDKVSAIKFLMANEKFQSPEDQAVLSDALEGREPKAPKAKKPKTEKVATVKASKKNVPSLDSIKARAKKSKASVEDVIAAVTETTE